MFPLEIDTSKALHKEKGWFLMTKDHCLYGTSYRDEPLHSVIVHVCPAHSVQYGLSFQDQTGTNRIMIPWSFRLFTLEGMAQTCGHCHSAPSKEIQALWILHNEAI